MKLKLTLALLVVASISFAQKREIQKIEKALSSGNYAEAKEVFSKIAPDEVEDKYKAAYEFSKGIVMLGNLSNSKVDYATTIKAKELVLMSKELGYDNVDNLELALSVVKNRLFMIAQEKLTAKDLQGAALSLEQLFNLDNSNLSIANDTGNIYYASGNLEKASEFFTMLFAKGYNGVTTKYFAERVTNDSKVEYADLKLRDKELKLGLIKNPTEVTSESIIGDIVLKQVFIKKEKSGLDTAKAFFQEALAMYPKDLSLKLVTPEIYLLLEMKEEYEKSSALLTEGITDPDVFNKLAAISEKNEQWDEVIKNYENSLKIKSDGYVALVNIANAYVQKGNAVETYKEQVGLFTSAVGYLEKAIAVDDTNKDVVNTLVQLYEILKMEDKLAALKAKQ